MRQRLAIALLMGLLLGLELGLLLGIIGSQQYEYGLVDARGCLGQDMAERLAEGWERVPNQPDPCYIRRSRFRLFPTR